MTSRSRPRRAAKTTPPSPYPEVGLAELGLAPGDTVRFRRRGSERWKQGVVSRRERDGSIGLHDSRGSARSIEIDLLEVRTRGPRGGVVWESLAERAARTEQMPLVRTAPADTRRRTPPLRAADEAPSPATAGDDPGDDAPADDDIVSDDPDPSGAEQLRLL